LKRRADVAAIVAAQRAGSTDIDHSPAGMSERSPDARDPVAHRTSCGVLVADSVIQAQQSAVAAASANGLPLEAHGFCRVRMENSV
jgi:hypothetical protein